MLFPNPEDRSGRSGVSAGAGTFLLGLGLMGGLEAEASRKLCELKNSAVSTTDFPALPFFHHSTSWSNRLPTALPICRDRGC